MRRRMAMRCCAWAAAAVWAASSAGAEKNAWDPAQWPRRMTVRVENGCGRALSGYQVKVVLEARLFDFGQARPDGADLRFTVDGGAPLPHWIEHYDSRARTAVVWVRVPRIPAAGEATIHLHYGNPGARSGSDGPATFEFFDDCQSGRPADKWEVAQGTPTLEYASQRALFGRPGGVWHGSGCTRRVAPGATRVYGGGHATYCAWTRPMAVYAPSRDTTFFSFGNAENSPTVAAYDHGSKRFSPAVVVGTNPDGDAHKNPHMLLDEDGYLYVFYRAHCTPTHLARSARPYDVSEWVPMGVVAENSSYPQPWQLRQGEICVFFRKGGTHDAGEACVRSRDGGRTWSEPTVVAASPPKNGFYAVTVAAAGPYPRTVHMAWSVTRGDWWQRYHVYYASSDDGGLTWRRSDGRAYAMPITEPDAERVFRSEVPDRGVWLQDAQVDAAGNLYVLFVDGHTLSYDCTWRLAVLSGERWRIHAVAPTDHMYDHGALVILGQEDLRAYLPSTPSQPYEDGGEIVEWQSGDQGATWTRTRRLTSGSRYAHNHVKTALGQQRGDFRVFWSYGDSGYPPETRDVTLYRYGEAMPGPQAIELEYPPQSMPGHVLVVAQPERIESLLRIKGLRLAEAAIAARVRQGPPEPQHGMLCAGMQPDGALEGAGLVRGRAKLYRHRARWSTLAEGDLSPGRDVWRQWELGASGDRLRFSVDGVGLAEASAGSSAPGSCGVRVAKSTLYLDDIRVRKFVLPEPVAVIGGEQARHGERGSPSPPGAADPSAP